jgi:hypothetical protein
MLSSQTIKATDVTDFESLLSGEMISINKSFAFLSQMLDNPIFERLFLADNGNL